MDNLDKLFFKDDFKDHERYVEENLKVLKKCVDPQRVEFIVQDWMSKNLNNIQSYLKDGEEFNINFTTEASRNLKSEFDSSNAGHPKNNNFKNETFGKNNEFKLDKLNINTEQTLHPHDLRLNLTNSEHEEKTKNKIENALDLLKTKQSEFYNDPIDPLMETTTE